ncbi:MAG: methyltransferase domain-containing protein [Planctomycetes bacterium]|nr:methyltransferase domain-containing protein [Planctomycetota bacterium]
MKGPNERYHDRVAPIYDDVYDRSPYWRYYRELTWKQIRKHLPRTSGAAILDLGCGTGEWGLRCMASGYRVTFVDLSNGMLARAQDRLARELPGKEARFLRADIAELGELDDGAFQLAIAQGDPLSFTEKPARAVKEIFRVLAPGGVAIASVDNRCAAYDHYLERADLEGLERLHRTGSTEWLAREASERFETHAFLPTELTKLFERAGFEVLELAGKTALDVRRHPAILESPASFRRCLAIEWECRKEPAFLGRAGHLEVTARRPAE